MREGVTDYIKNKFSTKEAIEKALGISLDEAEKQPVDAQTEIKEKEEFMAKARQVILQRSLESDDHESQS